MDGEDAMPLPTPAKRRAESRTPTTGSLRRTGGIFPVLLSVLSTLEGSAKARRTALGLFAVIAYLLVGRIIDPGFTEYWWYQFGQTCAILIVVLSLETLFANEGGLAWQTHGIVLMTAYADVSGTTSGFYDRFGPYDKIVHFWSGAAFAASTYEVLRLLAQRGTISLPPVSRALIALAISFAIAGVAWEIYEQLSDSVFNSGRVQSRIDTIVDLITDFCGGLAAVLVLQRRELARHETAHLHPPHATSKAITSRGR
jgi:hypothetical protein